MCRDCHVRSMSSARIRRRLFYFPFCNCARYVARFLYGLELIRQTYSSHITICFAKSRRQTTALNVEQKKAAVSERDRLNWIEFLTPYFFPKTVVRAEGEKRFIPRFSRFFFFFFFNLGSLSSKLCTVILPVVSHSQNEFRAWQIGKHATLLCEAQKSPPNETVIYNIG